MLGPPIAYWSFFLPVEYQLFCIVILIGLGTGAILFQPHRPAGRHAFEIPALAPPFIALAAQPLPHRHGGERVAYVASTLRVHAPHASHASGRPAAGYENPALLEQVRREKEAERSKTWKNRASWPPPAMTCASPCTRSACSLGLLTNEETHRAWPLPGGQHRQRDGGDGASVRRLAQHLQAGRRRDRAPAQVVPAQSAAGAVAGRSAAGGAERLVAAGQAQQGGGDSDPVLLERILRNLISNAIAHTRRGGVLVGCRHRRGGARILVCDTGPGIPPSEQGGCSGSSTS